MLDYARLRDEPAIMDALARRRLQLRMNPRTRGSPPCHIQHLRHDRNMPFHNLLSFNSVDSSNVLLFVTRHSLFEIGESDGHEGECFRVDDNYRKTLCFLDVFAKRWYTIRADDGDLAPLDSSATRLLVPNGGLLCEFCAVPAGDDGVIIADNGDHKIVLLDPVANCRLDLPEKEEPKFCHTCEELPILVPVVDDVAVGSFKVFVLFRSVDAKPWDMETNFCVYESTTGVWRSLQYPPAVTIRESEDDSVRGLGGSAVHFQGKLYTFVCKADGVSMEYDLLCYDLHEDRWTRAIVAGRENSPRYAQLQVFGNNLLMGMWGPDPTWYLPDRPDLADLTDYYDEGSGNVLAVDDFKFEIKEILVHDNFSTRLVVEIPGRALVTRFREFDLLFLQFVFISSNVVVLFSGSTGKAVTYDLRSGEFGGLPAHPLSTSNTSTEIDEQDVGYLRTMPTEIAYRANFVQLNCRDTLSLIESPIDR